MDVVGILTVGSSIISLLSQGVMFVEQLFSKKPKQGPKKKDMVMNFAEVAFSEFGSEKDQVKWEEAKPHVSNLIDELVAIMNILK